MSPRLTPRKITVLLLALGCLTICKVLTSTGYHQETRLHLARSNIRETVQWAMKLREDEDARQLTQRYESTEVWRTPDSFEPAYMKSNLRPKMPNKNLFRSRGEYLKQPLVLDPAYNQEKLFLMIKTGGSELWSKLPIHLLTTLTRIENFAIYSDAPGSIAGYEVIDILSNVTDKTKNRLQEFTTTYATQKWLHDEHGIYDHSALKTNMGWDLDRFKNIPMLIHAYNVAPPEVEWFVFMDADTYMFMDTLMMFLDRFDSNEPWYLGSTVPGLPFYFVHGGSGVALSRKAMELTVGRNPHIDLKLEETTMNACCGDMLVSLMVAQTANITGSSGYNFDLPEREQWDLAARPDRRHVSFQGNSVWDVQITHDNWCLPLISFHHVTPHDVERLYEYEKVTDKHKLLYRDIYHDFYKPYIQSVRINWDNNARDLVFSYEKDVEENLVAQANAALRPYASVDMCRKSCEKFDGCLAYRFLPHDRYCGLGFGLRLGHPVHPSIEFKYDHDMGKTRNNTGATSGWMMDRIANMTRECGPGSDLHPPRRSTP